MNTFLLSKLQQAIADKLEEDVTTEELVELEKNTAMLVADMMTLLEMTEGYADGLKAKAKEYAEKSKLMTEKTDKLEKKIIEIIKEYGSGNKITYNNLDFKIKKNPPKVEITDEELVPAEYKNGTIKMSAKDIEKVKIIMNKPDLTVKYDIDKTSIKALEKQGISVAGTVIIEEESLKR